jgi:poly(A) polymerase
LPKPSEDPLALIRAALAGRRAWLVGGAVRDRLLRRHTRDYDVVLDGDPGEAARALARAAGRSALGPATGFALSEEHGGWRVLARDGTWQVDLERLRGASLEEDLAARDFTVNAIAAPLDALGADGEEGAGSLDSPPAGTILDPLGGAEDLAHRRLRAVSPEAFAADPLRVLRLARLAVELELEPDAATRAQARAHAPGLRAVAGERVGAEVSRILAAPRAVAGVELMGEVGATAVVLPEVQALRGIAQSRYHHRDVYGHTLEVLERTVALDAACAQGAPALAALLAGNGEASPPARGRGEHAGGQDGAGRHAAALAALLAEPLADGLTRGVALRWGALLHDAAKPLTRGEAADPRSPGGRRVTFVGHDARGAELAQEVLARLRASGRLRAHVAALVRHHLRLGFLVHAPQPLARRTVYAYLRACEPVEVDVTLLSVADRLATRGDRAREAIDAHVRLARGMLDDALRWRAAGPQQPLWRGDELARALDLPLGPRVGALLEELAAARYAGVLSTREEALAHARAWLAAAGG